MKTMRQAVFLLIAGFCLLFAGADVLAGSTEIKVAVITPEGSAWTQALRRMAAEAEKRTHGEVRFRIYPGGISGDEMDVLRKIRVNRIHSAGFSGVGLGVIWPEVRILEAPLLFHSYEEIDFVKEQLFDEMAMGFEQKGFVLLGFAEAGFVYFFSREDFSKPDTLGKIRMWSWKGDPVAESFLRNFGIRAVPLHPADVITGLETGMIDSFYSPPLAAIAFQWHSRIRYLLDEPIVNSTGAFLISREMFDRLSADNQRIVRALSQQFCRELVHLSREDNRKSLDVMKAAGIHFIRPDAQQRAELEEKAEKTRNDNIGKLYSARLYQRVQGLLAQYRRAKGQ
jgi:TRAP-type transport system periplasmic protein